MFFTPKAKGGLFLASSLCDGLEDNNIKQVTTLLENKDADPNVLLPLHGVTPFHLVIGNKSETFAETVTKLFLRHGGNPNVRSVDGMTPVHVAAAWGRVKILELLLANGGDPLCLDDDGRSPFHYAFNGSYYNAIRVLGMYCEECQDDDDGGDEEEKTEPKIKIKLEKILVNRGNVIAEYVPSEIDLTDDIQNGAEEDMKAERFKCSTSNSYNSECDGTNSSFTDYSPKLNENITYRRGQSKIVKCEEISPILALDQCKFDVKRENVTDEKILIGKITNRLSNSFDISTGKLKNYNSGKNRDKNHEINKFSSLLPKPKYFKNNLNLKAKAIESPLLETSIVSKSPNFKIFPGKKHNGVTTTNQQRDKSPNWTKKYLTSKNTDCSSESEQSSTAGLSPIQSASSTPKRKFNRERCELENSYRKRVRDQSSTKTGLRQTYTGHQSEILDDVTDHRKIDDDNDQCINYHKSKTEKKGKLHMTVGNIPTKSESIKSYLESPGSSRPTSACYQYQSVKSESDLNDELELWDEIDSIYKDKGRTPSASISKIFDDSSTSLNLSRNNTSTEKAEISLHSEKTSDMSLDDVVYRGKINSDNVKKSTDSGNTEDYRTPMESIIKSSLDTLISVDEEYAYVDAEQDVAFMERRLRVIPKSEDMNRAMYESTWCNEQGELSTAASQISQRSSREFDRIFKHGEFIVSNASLRDQLIALGDHPGPITNTTYHVYLKRLYKLKRNNTINLNDGVVESQSHTEIPRSPTISNSLLSTNWVMKSQFYRQLEESALHEYKMPDNKRRYRGGMARTSFNYLLLDPRITKDLPRQGRDLCLAERWKIFLKAIFYVGKGKSARPLQHLYESHKIWSKDRNSQEGNEKIQRILNIWRDNKGVICHQVFPNSMEEEAFIREAAMIDALGTNHLSNRHRGTYYGSAATMTHKERIALGKYLLYKAMEILMHAGESQQFPRNIE